MLMKAIKGWKCQGYFLICHSIVVIYHCNQILSSLLLRRLVYSHLFLPVVPRWIFMSITLWSSFCQKCGIFSSVLAAQPTHCHLGFSVFFKMPLPTAGCPSSSLDAQLQSLFCVSFSAGVAWPSVQACSFLWKQKMLIYNDTVMLCLICLLTWIPDICAV